MLEQKWDMEEVELMRRHLVTLDRKITNHNHNLFVETFRCRRAGRNTLCYPRAGE